MQRFWDWASSVWVTGKTDAARVGRLNSVLPQSRTAAEKIARDAAGAEIKSLTKLGMAGCFAALVALAGVAEWLSPEQRAAMRTAGYFFAVAGVGAFVGLVLSIAEPTFRAKVARRIEEPDEPLTDEEDWHYSEALSERLWKAAYILERGIQWRLISGLRTLSLLFSGGTFCIALLSAVRAIG